MSSEAHTTGNSNPVLGGIENLLMRQLQASSAARAQLARLQGKTLALEMTGVGLNIYLECRADSIGLHTEYADEPAVIITGSPIALMEFARSQDQDGIRSGRVTFTGDVGIAMDFQKLFGFLSPDLEEELSRLVGDETAFRVSKSARDFFDWTRAAVADLGTKLSGHLVEQRKDTPGGEEIEDFLAQVDRLRADVDRASARTERLIKNTSTGEH